MMKTAMSIAGSDPSGGAGLQADLKTFHQFGVYGMAAVTLLTVQNTCEVRGVYPVEPEIVADQIRTAACDIKPHAVKTGALGNALVIAAVAREIAGLDCPVVVDPVMVSKHGSLLLEEEGVERLIHDLFPQACLITPNLQEARRIAPQKDIYDMARALAGFGPEAVLIKGGHADGDQARDLLYYQDSFEWLESPRQKTRHTHGTGCTLSAAITACLALGQSLPEAVRTAKHFIDEAIRKNPELGSGSGPLYHHASIG